MKYNRYRWAFISFACTKETEPKKSAPGIIAIPQKHTYLTEQVKTRYAQTLTRFNREIGVFLRAIRTGSDARLHQRLSSNLPLTTPHLPHHIAAKIQLNLWMKWSSV